MSVKIIPGSLSLTYIRNTGAAFGIFSGKTPLLSVVSIIFIMLLLIYYFKKGRQEGNYSRSLLFKLSLASMLGGALGNLADRIFRGYVIDYVDVRYFSVFNFSDIMINVGVGLLLLGFVMKRSKKTENSPPAPLL